MLLTSAARGRTDALASVRSIEKRMNCMMIGAKTLKVAFLSSLDAVVEL